MQVKDMMTADPACCTAETSLPEVARMMVSQDCGEIPVVDNTSSKAPIGVVTDRDIVCRTVANGLNPLDLTAADCMSKPAVTVTPEPSTATFVTRQPDLRSTPAAAAVSARPRSKSRRSMTTASRPGVV